MTNRASVLLLATAGLMSFVGANGQGLYNSSEIYVGVDMFVDGEIWNSGSLTNESHILCTSHWENEGNYAGAGTLVLGGSSPQRLNHNGQDLSRLVIDGPGTKYIEGVANIVEELSLQDGVIEVSAGDILRLRAKAVVVGGDRNSFVDGALTVQGTGYKFFPIGKKGHYAPIEFLDVKGQSPEFAVEAFDNPPTVSVEDAVVRGGIFWQRNDISGEFAGSRIAVDYDGTLFGNTANILLITGADWTSAFSVLNSIQHSMETDKVQSQSDVYDPIIMLGEITDQWRPSDFYLSTALSPNASYVENRNVKVFGDRLDSRNFHFQVFNRRGEVVFESTSLELMQAHGWNGEAANGSELPTGTYPFRLTGLDKTGFKFEKTGVITLLY